MDRSPNLEDYPGQAEAVRWNPGEPKSTQTARRTLRSVLPQVFAAGAGPAVPFMTRSTCNSVPSAQDTEVTFQNLTSGVR